MDKEEFIKQMSEESGLVRVPVLLSGLTMAIGLGLIYGGNEMDINYFECFFVPLLCCSSCVHVLNVLQYGCGRQVRNALY